MPSSPSSLIPRWVLFAVVAVLALVSVFALVRTVSKTVEPNGGFDFHPDWLAGHYLRVGINPYLAYRDNLPLPAPVPYIDGSTVAPDAIAQPGLGRVPANTAPMLVWIMPLAWLPWAWAKGVWLAFNLLLIVLIPWMVLRLLPPAWPLARPLEWLSAFAFYAMKGPRESAATGQTSLLVFALMLAALLLRKRSWWWAGIALGIALSKYSLALPVAIFFAFERRWRVLAVAVGVQVAALLVVAAPSGLAIGETMRVQWDMVEHHSSQVGIHLAYLLRDRPLFAAWATIAGTLVVAGAVVWSWWRGWSDHHLLPINSLLVLWLLVAVYHRNYDSLVTILFLVLILAAATTWGLGRRQAVMLGLVWLLGLGVMALPGDIVRPLMGDAQATRFMHWVDRVATFTICVMVLVNLWLLPRVPRRMAVDS